MNDCSVLADIHSQIELIRKNRGLFVAKVCHQNHRKPTQTQNTTECNCNSMTHGDHSQSPAAVSVHEWPVDDSRRVVRAPHAPCVRHQTPAVFLGVCRTKNSDSPPERDFAHGFQYCAFSNSRGDL